MTRARKATEINYYFMSWRRLVHTVARMDESFEVKLNRDDSEPKFEILISGSVQTLCHGNSSPTRCNELIWDSSIV